MGTPNLRLFFVLYYLYRIWYLQASGMNFSGSSLYCLQAAVFDSARQKAQSK